MCLIIESTKKPKAVKAETSISCYKILYSINKNYYTPYRHTKVKLNTFLRPEFSLKRKIQKYSSRKWAINGGFIHAFTDRESALYIAKGLNGLLQSVQIYKAYIPKGTFYFENNKEICAKKLYITDLKVRY